MGKYKDEKKKSDIFVERESEKACAVKKGERKVYEKCTCETNGTHTKSDEIDTHASNTECTGREPRSLNLKHYIIFPPL